MMLKLDFQEDFMGRVTGQAGVIEMKLTERVVYSLDALECAEPAL